MSEGTASPGALFDALADDYEAMREQVGWSPWPHVHEALGADGALDGWRVLDVGCGTGEVARALTARGARVVGVDVSPRMCALAALRAPRASFSVADLGQGLPMARASFDAVLALGCLEYVADVEGACAELARVARPGAVVLYAVELCGDGLPGGPARRVPMFDDWARHRRPLEAVAATARRLLEAVEVEVVPAYTLEETGERLVYARVLGLAPG